MPLSAGDKLGPYEIVSMIGKGGMGEVWKARDTRLDRIVAIKVSQEKFSERFEREARAVAALNHPNICTLHDVGPNFLVMEYIEGVSLKGPLPLAQVLRYGAQVCDALDAAHKKGITHRDLKPQNILVTRTGVKLLDFGLARIVNADQTLTMAGEVMGTPSYMSPEQWEGKPGDARSDIYAFGCVLYEMLTGKRAAQDRVPVEPPALESVLRTCFEREPEDRWQTAREVKRELLRPVETAPSGNPWRERVAWIAVALSFAGALFFGLRPASTTATGNVYRLSINPPDKTFFTPQYFATVGVPQFALSPDGTRIAFVAAAPGARPTLWIRSLSEIDARKLPGTEGADTPFWSPDSLRVGYFSDGKLKRIPAMGGPSQEIAAVSDPRGGSWGADETILFAKGSGGIYRVRSSGGMITTITERDASREEGSHRFPQYLPDGQHFLYSVRSSLTDLTGIYVGSLDGKTKKLLIQGNTNAIYASSGQLLFMDGDTLMGQEFDAEHLTLKGQEFVVEGQVGRSSIGAGSFSASRVGTLAYANSLSEPGRLTWFDRRGNPHESIGQLGDYSDFRLSPDQTRLAASLINPKTGFPDVWLTDIERSSFQPFTFGPAVNASPVWSPPDGARILFRTTRKGGLTEFYQKSAGGGGEPQPVLLEDVVHGTGVRGTNLMPWDFSPDGRSLLFSAAESGDLDLWLLPFSGDLKPVRYLTGPGDQLHANFSPNGGLVAYSSNESGRFQVYVQDFPLSEHQRPVSNNGGHEPRWRADGLEIYYLSEDRQLMAVSVFPGPRFGPPQLVFPARISGGVSALRTHYVPSRDGQRFLINTPAGDPVPVPITIVLNWTAGLKK